MHGFFSVPVDHLHALRELAAHFRGRDLSRAVVVSPDLGNAKSAAAFARRLGLPVAAGAKQRISDSKVIISAIIGDVAGRDVIVLDDEIARGTTRARAAGPAAGAGRPFGRASPARTACSPTARWRSSPRRRT